MPCPPHPPSLHPSMKILLGDFSAKVGIFYKEKLYSKEKLRKIFADRSLV
jgi:hypothetical protein